MAAGAGFAAAPGWAQDPPSGAAQQIEIIGTAPLAGPGVDRELLPYASHRVQRQTIDQAQAEQLTDLLARRLPGMQVNDIQGSPLQGDLSYRGFRASGLLGAPQGLSVYLDGIRINEPFGDVVLWDMIPEFALQSITVLPGANPAFGLNTLGGAIALATDSGLTAPGLHAELGFGSRERRRASVALGQQHGQGWHSYVGATAFGERGWRDESPGEQGMALARVGRRQGATEWDIGLLAGRSRLVGNGLLPAYTLRQGAGDAVVASPDLYAASRSAIYTHPDRSRNQLAQLSLHASLALDADRRLQALVYYRSSRRDAVTGDVGDAAADPLLNASDAALNSSQTRQRSWGLAGSVAGRSAGHQWQAGLSIDASRVSYGQFRQAGSFDAGRGVVTGQAPALPSAAVDGQSLHVGLYGTDTWRIAPQTHLTATLRLNQARVANQLASADAAGDPLVAQPSETFHYRSLNPAIGLTHGLAASATLFANLARNTRVPTAIELGCADPAKPCRLPAGLQSDPYLKQVRSTSLEAGLRWRPAANQRVELSVYRTDNRDDILFGSLGATSQLGYFSNFDRTRNEGVDLQWSGRSGPLQFSAAFSQIRATYQADGLLRFGERNVTITPGTPMAGLPRRSAKLAADWQATPALSVGADWQLMAGRGVQGNEDGRLQDDDPAGSHPLRVAGYGLLNLRAAWWMQPGVQWLLRLQNVLDRRHESYGALASTVFDAQGRYTGQAREAVFVAPGAPRSVFVGLRIER